MFDDDSLVQYSGVVRFSWRSPFFPGCRFWPLFPTRCAFLLVLFRLLEAIRVRLDGDDLRTVDQAVHQGDNAGGIGEHLAPLREGTVGGHQR